MLESFSGVKLALFYEGKLLVYQRENKPNLRWSNLWDFPGGGRESTETPFQCAQREVTEEFGFMLAEDQVRWQRVFPAMHDSSQKAYFMVGTLSPENVNQIQFGDEGQQWKFMSPESFLASDNVVPKLKTRLSAYLQEAVID